MDKLIKKKAIIIEYAAPFIPNLGIKTREKKTTANAPIILNIGTHFVKFLI